MQNSAPTNAASIIVRRYEATVTDIESPLTRATYPARHIGHFGRKINPRAGRIERVRRKSGLLSLDRCPAASKEATGTEQ
jgi:hypothetical protein